MYFSWTSASGESSGRAGVDDLKITEKKMLLSNAQKKTDRAYVTGQQKEEEGRKFVCSKHDRAITCVFIVSFT